MAGELRDVVLAAHPASLSKSNWGGIPDGTHMDSFTAVALARWSANWDTYHFFISSQGSPEMEAMPKNSFDFVVGYDKTKEITKGELWD